MHFSRGPPRLCGVRDTPSNAEIGWSGFAALGRINRGSRGSTAFKEAAIEKGGSAALVLTARSCICSSEVLGRGFDATGL